MLKNGKLTLDEFIEKHWSEVKGLFRQYYDGVRTNAKQSEFRVWKKGKLERLSKSTERVSLIDPYSCDDDNDCKEPAEEEGWQKNTSKTSSSTVLSGYYQEPAAEKVRLSVDKTPKKKTK